ncbi:MAG TPA: hydrolase [Thermoanaerobaculia bacterium]|jgi:isochorismate hydrolase
MPRLTRDQALLVIIDVQEKLMPVIDDGKHVLQNVDRLIRGTHVLGVPALVTEQYVKGLGPTVASIRHALEETHGYRPIEKACFSAHGCTAFSAQVEALERPQVLIAGVETHVCVWQTVTDLLGAGYRVSVVADAVSSRTLRNRDLALQRMAAEGASITSTEMALFEMTVTSGTEEFKKISKIIK